MLGKRPVCDLNSCWNEPKVRKGSKFSTWIYSLCFVTSASCMCVKVRHCLYLASLVQTQRRGTVLFWKIQNGEDKQSKGQKYKNMTHRFWPQMFLTGIYDITKLPFSATVLLFKVVFKPFSGLIMTEIWKKSCMIIQKTSTPPGCLWNEPAAPEWLY